VPLRKLHAKKPSASKLGRLLFRSANMKDRLPKPQKSPDWKKSDLSKKGKKLPKELPKKRQGMRQSYWRPRDKRRPASPPRKRHASMHSASKPREERPKGVNMRGRP